MLTSRRNYGILLAIVFLVILSFSSTTYYSPRVLSFPSFDHVSTVTSLSSMPKNTSPPSQDSHTILRSVTKKDGNYWSIDFPSDSIINPNIIPHPTLPYTWIVVAARIGDGAWCVQITCNAQFSPASGSLKCLTNHAEILPIAATFTDKCNNTNSGYDILEMNIGPHDARVFYGPRKPYIIYGSNSGFTCFGQWYQDFRALIDWPDRTWRFEQLPDRWLPKELQRPKWGLIEKNWFLFWDAKGEVYAHYDIWPKRSFAKIDLVEGSVGSDIAGHTADKDEKCMQAYVPKMIATPPVVESIHQATNALAIVLCQRSDLDCNVAEKTFIMHIYQHKVWEQFHGVYEPYIVLFHNTPPFGIYGMSKKPYWLAGRGGEGEGKVNLSDIKKEDWKQTEMVYITSMNWRDPLTTNYTGYLDDVIMLGFGIEDQRSAVLDVRAGDLLVDLGLCTSVM